ncbi:protein F43G9.7 [Aphelenchoides avenae]|nr:protein F43G9.7 [Aphelenchus avenae]
MLQRKVAAADWKMEADQRVNEHYEALETTILECVKESEVRRPACREPRKTEETRALMRQLQQLKEEETKEPEECRRLSRLVRERLMQDYSDYRNRRLVETAEARQSLKKCRRNLAQTRQIAGALRDEDGELQTEREAIEEVCRRLYTTLFDSKAEVERTEEGPAERTTLLPVTDLEVEAALKKFKNGKAPGPDGITAEMLKKGGLLLWKRIAKLFTLCLRTRRIPLKWKESRTVLLHKKGDTEDLKNYRPICILPVIYKLFTKVVLNRITEQLDAAQLPEQAGFRSGFSTSDHMQTLNQIQERAREKGMWLYLVFIDYEKAFDSIEINAVLNALARQGISRSYIDVLEDVYEGCTTEIKLFHDVIKIPIRRGVRQGDTISPKLFTAATMWDCRRNEDIRAETRFKGVFEEANRRKLSWAGHVARREDGRWTIAATNWNPNKKPPPRWGKPTRWEQYITRKAGPDWRTAAQRRSLWRSQCTATPSPPRPRRQVLPPADSDD